MSNNNDQPKSRLQSLLDNMWLLLILGVGIYFVSYIIWGWVEIALIPPIPTEILELNK